MRIVSRFDFNKSINRNRDNEKVCKSAQIRFCAVNAANRATVPVSFCATNTSMLKKAAAHELKTLYINTAKLFRGITSENLANDQELTQSLISSIDFITAKDPELIKLKILSDKYLKTLSIEDKKLLLKQEEEIHWQELKNPEFGVVRNYFELINNDLENDTISAIQMGTMNGIGRLYQAYKALGLNPQMSTEHLNALESFIETFKKDTPWAEDIATKAFINIINYAEDKKSVTKIAKFIVSNSKFENLKSMAKNIIVENKEYDESSLFIKFIDKKSDNVEKISVITELAKNKSNRLKMEIHSTINDANISQSVKLSLIWAAGKCKMPQNFNIVKEIALNNASNPQEREIALHSMAQYLRSNENDVKNVLKTVIKEKSDLSELAQILLEKCEGRYYKKDKELSQLTKSEINKYKKLRDKYVITDTKLNTQTQNIIDMALVPFAKTLSTLSKCAKLNILRDTITKIFKENVGKRTFSEDLRYAGDFEDSIVGYSDHANAVIHKSEIVLPTKFNTTAHEFNHNFLQNILDDKDSKRLIELYKNALFQHKYIDSYAKLDESEYFAQGYEAYNSIYKPHDIIHIDNTQEQTMCHVRSTLKRKDPELYKFIEYCIKKYNV